MSQRFDFVIDWLRELQSRQPQHSSEIEIAIGMIRGTRPNIEQKYDALLLKLDREYSRLEDDKRYWEKKAQDEVLMQRRLYAQRVVKSINRMLVNMVWMRARNRDMVELKERKSQNEQSETSQFHYQRHSPQSFTPRD